MNIFKILINLSLSYYSMSLNILKETLLFFAKLVTNLNSILDNRFPNTNITNLI